MKGQLRAVATFKRNEAALIRKIDHGKGKKESTIVIELRGVCRHEVPLAVSPLRKP